jgi:hypothetical protein
VQGFKQRGEEKEKESMHVDQASHRHTLYHRYHPTLPPGHNRIAHSRRPRHDANLQRENDQTKRNRTTVSSSLDRQKRQEANSNITRICLFLTVVILITLVFAVHGLLSPPARSIAVDPYQIPKSI